MPFTKEENIIRNENAVYKQFLEDIKTAQKNNSLIIFIGAGVSISQGYPNWDGYVEQYLKYWTYHLNELIEKDVTVESKIDRNDIILLNYFSMSNYSNKRKVDFTNHLIKKYSKDERGEKESAVRYNANVLNFEKTYFSEIPPLISENKVLNELIKLQGIFITTNYDREIENSFEFVNNIEPDVVKGINELAINPRLRSVIHLHGTPEVDPDFFISSSQSYSNLYYKKNEHVNKFAQVIENKNKPLILFVGCSMEEDEILTLLDFKNTECKYYSLMKFDNNQTEYVNNFIFDYYSKSKNIKFIWYGDEYSDLDGFTNKLIYDINKDNNEHRLLYPDNKNQFIDELNKLIEKKEFYFLDETFAKYEEFKKEKIVEMLSYSIESLLYKGDELLETYNFMNYWNLLSIYYSELSKEEKKIILNIIENIKGVNRNTEISIYKIIIDEVESDNGNRRNQIDNIKKYLKFSIKSNNVPYYLLSNDINCLWLVEKLNKEYQSYNTVYLYEESVVFNFDEVLENEFFDALQVFSDKKMIFEVKHLLNFTWFKALMNLIVYNGIEFMGKSIFPSKFFEIKIIQRLFAFIDVNKENIDENYIKLIVENIDKLDKLYGSDMNDFVKKNKKYINGIEENYFKDGIFSGPSIMQEIKNSAFLPVDDMIRLIKESEIIFINTLEKNIDESPKKSFNYTEEINISGQIKEFNKLFAKESIWNGLLYDSTKKVMFKILDNKKVFQCYRVVITDFIIKATERGIDTKELFVQYCNKRFNHDNVLKFDIEDEKLFTVLLTEKVLDNKIVTGVLTDQIDIGLLEFNKEENSTYIDINNYINTDLGKYVNVLEIVNKQKNCSNDKLRQIICKSPKMYRNYLIGRFIELYNIETEFDADIQIFQGFSHCYNIGSVQKYINYFKDCVFNSLFEGNFDDIFSSENVTFIMIQSEIPTVVLKEKNINERMIRDIFSKILYLYTEIEHEYVYIESWIEKILQSFNFISHIVYNLISKLSEIKEVKIIKILNILNKINLHENFEKLSYISLTISNVEYSIEMCGNLIDLIEILLDKSIVYIDSHLISELNKVFQIIENKENGKPLIEKLLSIIKPYLTGDDYSKLKYKYQTF